jgi:hypothetical protein
MTDGQQEPFRRRRLPIGASFDSKDQRGASKTSSSLAKLSGRRLDRGRAGCRPGGRDTKPGCKVEIHSCYNLRLE